MRRRNNSPRYFISEELVKRVHGLMDNRRRLLAPFPVDPQAVYEAGWTKEEREAIALLRRKEGQLLREGKSMKLAFRMRDKDFVVALTLPVEQPMAWHFTLRLKDLPKDMAVSIAHWIPLWWNLNAEQARLAAKIKDCARVCKTYGQLYRMWPDVLSLMNDRGKEKIGSARVRSAYPQDAYRVERLEEGAQLLLREEFRPEAFEPFTAMIAECLMLPETNLEEVARVEYAKN